MENLIPFVVKSNQPNNEKRDLKELEKITGLRYAMLYKIIVLNNEIDYVKIGRKIVVSVKDIEDYITAHTVSKRG